MSFIGEACQCVLRADGITCRLRRNPRLVIEYSLSDADKERFRIGVDIGIRMMFLAGAKKVIVPSNENILGLPDFDPMVDPLGKVLWQQHY